MTSASPGSNTPFVIGVAGGSGSGKTTVTRRVIETVGAAGVAVLNQDNYYLDQSGIAPEVRRGINYDHPAAFDWPLLREHLDALLSGAAIPMPTYDFTKDTRAPETQPLLPAPVVVLEGFFALYDEELRRRMHLKVFVDADADVRFIRRLTRDTRERGRSLESVITQYLDYVRPMHLSFVEPTKRYADVIIQHGGMNAAASDLVHQIKNRRWTCSQRESGRRCSKCRMWGVGCGVRGARTRGRRLTAALTPGLC